MPERPTSLPTGAPASGRIEVAGATDGAPGVTVAWHERGGEAEAVVVPADGASADDHALVERIARAVGDLRAELAGHGVSLRLAADHPAEVLDPIPEAVADAAGLTDRRDLLQLRRPLPVPVDHPTRAAAPALATRAFVPGSDDDAWIRVNNRAFAAHPDQGRETAATLADRMAEPWFDAAGFLVADEPDGTGELAGFCWTKVHDHEPAERFGEIYVIGVDPRHRGEGLGPALVLAGLDHLAALGIRIALLYVDADNAPALRLYDALGFATHRRRRVYSTPGTRP